MRTDLSGRFRRIFQPESGIRTTLANTDYRLLLGSSTLWWLALYMEMIVLGWLVLEITDSAGLVGLVGFCRSIPSLLVGGFGGLLADRFGRRPLVIASQTITFCMYATVAVLLAAGLLAIWHLVVIALTLGCAWAMDWPTRRALIPDLVGRPRVVDALMLENLGMSIARALGPLLAGLVLDAYDVLGCFLTLSGLSAISLLLLRALSRQPIPRTSSPTSASPLAQIRDSVLYVRQNQSILAVTLITMIMNMLAFPYMNFLPVFARDVLNQGPVGLGYLGASVGIGNVVGLFLVNWARRFTSPGWIFIAGTLLQCMALLTFTTSSVFAVSWALLLLVGIGHACFGIMQSSIVLLAAADERRGQAMGAIAVAIGAGPFGKLQTGILADAFGAPLAVGAEAALAALLVAAVAATLPELRQVDSSEERAGDA
ncbi:MAG: MFS transporter [Caldilineaceae bacterium SB0675_bin_29]|uniref:MFS transporter n=1 Tax=Caldilineaceae bacterium SB0675_bin_29 TaxID=2605266 RepID=A0A6B1G724_9CHLR|nr:MFS transporter [Caldilineaceae bacterium SB0675_bin_29]